MKYKKKKKKYYYLSRNAFVFVGVFEWGRGPRRARTTVNKFVFLCSKNAVAATRCDGGSVRHCPGAGLSSVARVRVLTRHWFRRRDGGDARATLRDCGTAAAGVVREEGTPRLVLADSVLIITSHTRADRCPLSTGRFPGSALRLAAGISFRTERVRRGDRTRAHARGRRRRRLLLLFLYLFIYFFTNRNCIITCIIITPEIACRLWTYVLFLFLKIF